VDAGTVIDEVSTMASKSVGKFGAKVSQLRKERRLSQEELAERSGVSQTFVSKMEKAETQETAGTPALVAKVLAFLDTDANKIKDLLLDEDPDGAMVGAEERAPDPSSAYDFGIDDFGPAAADSPGGTVPVAAVPPRVDPMEARRVWQEARAKERDDLMARGFLFDKTTESTQGAYGEVVDALGRAFDHRVHRLTDTHIILEMLDSTMGSSKESRARLVDCWPQELDIGCRLALNAVKQLRRQGIPITLKNVFIALAVFAGREVVKANAGRDVYLSEPPPADVPDMPF
jgi:transcriptional regulator with XRE-family HTH domain